MYDIPKYYKIMFPLMPQLLLLFQLYFDIDNKYK